LPPHNPMSMAANDVIVYKHVEVLRGRWDGRCAALALQERV
jgi:hypothetical protein